MHRLVSYLPYVEMSSSSYSISSLSRSNNICRFQIFASNAYPYFSYIYEFRKKCSRSSLALHSWEKNLYQNEKKLFYSNLKEQRRRRRRRRVVRMNSYGLFRPYHFLFALVGTLLLNSSFKLWFDGCAYACFRHIHNMHYTLAHTLTHYKHKHKHINIIANVLWLIHSNGTTVCYAAHCFCHPTREYSPFPRYMCL